MATTPKQRVALDQYTDLMHEAKLRLECIDTALAGKTELLPPAIREFCFLQLRMLCEVIALGCLTVHGHSDFGSKTKITKENKANKILATLEKLHPHFYPRSCTQDPNGPKYNTVMDSRGGLTKSDLLRLYKRCGNHLHRGTLKTLFSPAGPHSHTYFPDIIVWRDKIRTLLWYHAIFLLNKNQMVLFTLKNPEADNRVTWALLESENISSLV